MRQFILFSLTIIFSLSIVSLQAQRNYAESSVLTDGDWYKVGVVETGIYRLEKSFFDNLGINTAEVDPRNIQVYGNGGGMIPQANEAFRHDDLVENAIHVEGQGDGNFDAGDYVLFYGEGPHGWNFDQDKKTFSHELNLYSDTNYYFIRIGDEAGKRVEEQVAESPATYTPTKGTGIAFHELDKENLIKSGRYWMGEKFDLITSRSFSFYMPEADPNGEITLRVKVAARSDVTSSFSILANGSNIGTLSINSVNVTNNESMYYRPRSVTYTLSGSLVANDSLRITLNYNKAGSSRSEGWLDWLEVEYDQALNTRNLNVMDMHLLEGVAEGEVAEIQLGGASSNYTIWEVSDLTNVEQWGYTISSDNKMEFITPADSMKHFVIFKGGFLSPSNARKIANQNLHDPALYDYIIFSYPDFGQEAERLAQFHRDHYGRTVRVVYPEELYNEFSCGRQDVCAYRDYLKMIYDRSEGTHPQFALFFGDGSYDYKNITQAPTVRNFLPTYQSRTSNNPTTSYTSDDFYAMLDDSDGFWGEGTGGGDTYSRNHMDVALGRLPIETIEEATGIVDKIINYVTNENNFGSWRNRVVLVADHKEGEGYTHVSQADAYTSIINRYEPCINLEKIYMDNYPVDQTAGGTFFPEGRDALQEQFRRGSLIVNYTGHGGEYAWSNSRILNLSDIQSMGNGDRQPAVITATCEFGRYDDQDRRSGAEIFVMKPDGGAIALFTTLRLVYSSPNATLNRNLYHEAFKYDTLEQRMPTIGEIMMRTKNRTFPLGQTTDINSRNFTLLGDPGLILAYPEMEAQVTKINERPVDLSVTDSLASLSKISVSGIITDSEGNHLDNYTGDMAITVFDKPSKFITRLAPFPFYWQTNRIFNGNASVENGEFNFEFVVPIDVSYEDGEGKFSLYFNNTELDGHGCYNNLYIGGTDQSAEPDLEGPKIKLYMNNDAWIDGGQTGPSPYLYAVLFDENGINLVGSGIGHEIVGVLDGDEGNIIILNEYYTAERDDYQRGSVYYQLKDLEEGEHDLKLRVWDVANNWAEASTNFIVGSDARLVLHEILNYPNPMKDETSFLIGFSQTDKDYDVTVRIVAETGQTVKVLEGSFYADGNYYRGLSWDGLTTHGNVVNNGIYVYQVTLTDKETGQVVHKANKLVVLR
jgi:hypothetical protein